MKQKQQQEQRANQKEKTTPLKDPEIANKKIDNKKKEDIKTTEKGSEEIKIETIEDNSTQQEDEVAELNDKYIRLYAEFDNYRKRTTKEKIETIQYANEGVITKILPILDDFERAEKLSHENPEKSIEGFLLIHTKLTSILKQCETKVMNVGKGVDFDPDFHESITQIPTPEEKLKGKVIDVVEKGYTMHEKVIRYAKVVIGK